MSPRITHEQRGNEHRIYVEDYADAGEAPDMLIFVFTDEGVITDAVTGGIVEATESSTYDEIEDRLQ